MVRRALLATAWIASAVSAAAASAAAPRPVPLRAGSVSLAGPTSRPSGTHDLVGAPFRSGARELVLVQVVGRIGPAARVEVAAAGGAELGTLPASTLLVSVDRTGLDVLSASAGVEAVAWLEPWMRVHPALLNPFRDLPLDVMLAGRLADADVAATLTRWRLAGLDPAPNGDDGAWTHVTLRASRGDLPLLASAAPVAWIALHHEPQLLMAVARTSSDVPTGRGQLAGPILDVERAWRHGLLGQGQVVAVCDSGLDTGTYVDGARPRLHADFGEVGSATNPLRVVATFSPHDMDPGQSRDWSDGVGHGTDAAGVVLGGGVLSGSQPHLADYEQSQAGVAPRASLVVQAVFGAYGTPSIGNWSAGLFGPPHGRGARIHSNSWSGGTFGEYEATSAQIDRAAWDMKDLVIVFGAGNRGTDGYVPPNEAGWSVDACASPSAWTLVDSYQIPPSGECPFATDRWTWAVNPDPCRAPHARGLDACLTTPALPVDPARPPSSLEIVHDLDALAGDEAVVLLDRDDDGTFETELARMSGPTPGSVLTTRWQLDPTGWGVRARVRFRFTSDGAVEGLGWSIHDVELHDGLVGPDSIPGTGAAKNILTVGASETYRPGSRDDVASEGDCLADALSDPTGEEPLRSDEVASHASGLAGFSSRGPCDDGRMKPDLVAPGTFVAAPRSRAVLPEYQVPRACGMDAATAAAYSWFGGTSCATPLVSGAAALVRQYFASGWHAHGSAVTHVFPVAAEGFEPSAALVKATLLAGAFPMSPGQFAPPAIEIPAATPNAMSGHGRLDVTGALFPHEAWGASRDARLLVHDDRSGLSTGGSVEIPFEVIGSRDGLRATLTWTDPPALPLSAVALVNDLDLALVAPDGTVHRPGPGGGPDRRDNVETLRLDAGAVQSGTWRLVVVAFDVPGVATAPGSTVQPFAVALVGDLETGCAQDTTAPQFDGLASAAIPPGTCGTIDLAWPAGSDACGPPSYRVHASASSPVEVGPDTLVAETFGTSLRLEGLSAITTYHVLVRAVDGSGNEEANVIELVATTPATDGAAPCPDCPIPPPVEGTLRASSILPDGVRLAWSPPSGGPPAAGYLVLSLAPARDFSRVSAIGPVVSPQLDVAGVLRDGAFHAWRVVALNECAESP